MTASRKKILIVEDDKALREGLRDKLMLEGFIALEAVNGEEGLASALFQKPDLILLDVVMPKMDGLTMLKKLREDPWGREAKVILLTNLNDNKSVSAAMGQGTFDYLVKSDWKIADVVAKIRLRLASA